MSIIFFGYWILFLQKNCSQLKIIYVIHFLLNVSNHIQHVVARHQTWRTTTLTSRTPVHCYGLQCIYFRAHLWIELLIQSVTSIAFLKCTLCYFCCWYIMNKNLSYKIKFTNQTCMTLVSRMIASFIFGMCSNTHMHLKLEKDLY